MHTSFRKYYLFSLFIIILTLGCRNEYQPLKIELLLEEYEGDIPVKFIASGKESSVYPDSLGAVVFLPESGNREGVITYKNFYLPLYLDDIEDLNIYINLSDDQFGAQFFGEGALKNEIWNGKYAPLMQKNDYLLDEADFLEKLTGGEKKYMVFLDSLYLEKKFKRRVIARFRNLQIPELLDYPNKYRELLPEKDYFPSPRYKKILFERISGIDNTTPIPDNLIPLLVNWFAKYEPVDTLTVASGEKIIYQLEWIDSAMNHQQIKNELATTLALNFINQCGIEDISDLRSIFFRVVTEPSYQEKLNLTIEGWEKLKPGEPAPFFETERVDSSRVSLNDFRGNYIYLTIWDINDTASIEMLGNYSRLATAFQGKNVSFVAIGYGMDREKWSNLVTQHKLRGIQLFTSDKNTLDPYILRDSLRYVWIDPSGKIADAFMSPPNERATMSRLRNIWPQRIIRDRVIPMAVPLQPVLEH